MKHFSSVVVAIFFCFTSHAITVPCQTPTSLGLNEFATEVNLKGPGDPIAKKEGFFRKLKTKLAGFLFGRRMTKAGQTSTKAVLGWVALGLVVLGIGLMVANSGPTSGDYLWVSVAGFVTGIVALLVKGKEKEPREKKKEKTAAIVAIAIAVGIGIAVIIALSTLHF